MPAGWLRGREGGAGANRAPVARHLLHELVDVTVVVDLLRQQHRGQHAPELRTRRNRAVRMDAHGGARGRTGAKGDKRAERQAGRAAAGVPAPAKAPLAPAVTLGGS